MGHSALEADNESVASRPQIPFPKTDLSREIVGWEGQNDPRNPWLVLYARTTVQLH